MALPSPEQPHQWLDPANIDAAVEHLLDYARLDEGMSPSELGNDPFGALAANAAVSISIDEEPTGGCSVFGHYSSDPPTLHVVRASVEARDNFTLLHEYAHHLQQHDPDWVDVDWQIEPESLRRRVSEEIADAFASQVLIPQHAVNAISDVPRAEEIASLHASTRASRQAAIVRVARVLRGRQRTAGTTEHVFLSLAVCDGEVVFSQRLGEDLAPPPRGLKQPDIEYLAAEAMRHGRGATGLASNGITYTTGNTRHDVRLDVFPAHDGPYCFVVGRKEHRYGKPSWGTSIRSCPSSACGTDFQVDDTLGICSNCRAPHCPECRACDCAEKEVPVCTRCFTTLSAVDVAASRTCHEECE